MNKCKDCKYFKEENSGGDILHCMEQNEKIVADDFYCENWN